MTESVCNGNPMCLHGEGDRNEDVDMEWQVEEADPSGRYIRYKEILGKGAFKTVYRGFDDIEGIEVAWNQIKLQDILRSPQDLERLYSEVHLLKTLKHRNIIKFHHSWVDTDANRINIITELFTSGTLRQYRKRHKHVDLRAVKNWCRQILRGLLYLHSHDPPIIHRDLKCDNIFINGNQGEVKIGDLGLATILYQAPAAHSIIGTPEFMAPELYEEEYTELADVYSFGMCLLEMATFEYPYSECDNAAQIYKKVSSGIKPAALDKLKDVELREFVEKCIAVASKRLPARDLLMDPFLCHNMDQDDGGSILSRNASKSRDMEDFGALLQSTSLRSSLFTNTETSSASLASPPVPLVHAVPKNPIRRAGSVDLKQDKLGRNVDFRVKGKRRDNDIVYLRFRISAEGNVRIIHFPFDVEADTAMCVASEMVEELDLADQDVTKIAEMIDAAVVLMVPEWKSGVAIDERCEAEESSGPIRQGSVGSTLAGLALPSLQHKSIHGRFEEVMYLHHRDQQGNHEEELCTLTTSDEAADDWEQSDLTTSSDASPVCQDVPCSLSGMGDGVAADTFIGFRESGDLVDTAGKPSADLFLAGGDFYGRVMDAWALFQDDFGGDGDRDSQLLVQEIKNLTFQFQQDLKGLHGRHQEALLELKKRWHGRRGAQHAMRNGGKMEDDQGKEEAISEANEHERSLEKTWSKNGREKKCEDQAGRLSFKELADLLAQVEPLEELNKSS